MLYMYAFALWPLAIVVASLLNMLFALKFSWSELVINILVGYTIGLCYFFCFDGNAEWYEHLFLTVSTGLFGLLKWAGVDYFNDPLSFFLWAAISVPCVVLISALLDLASVALRKEAAAGSGAAQAGEILVSIILFILKAPFALVTTVVGLLIGIIGLIVSATNGNGGFVFGGGAFFFKWGMSGKHATTFGTMVNVFKGTIDQVFQHELYHTRQYVYLHDWLGVYYFTIAGLWGLISSAAAGDFQGTYLWQSHDSKEYGNPIESVPYRNKW